MEDRYKPNYIWPMKTRDKNIPDTALCEICGAEYTPIRKTSKGHKRCLADARFERWLEKQVELRLELVRCRYRHKGFKLKKR